MKAKRILLGAMFALVLLNVVAFLAADAAEGLVCNDLTGCYPDGGCPGRGSVTPPCTITCEGGHPIINCVVKPN